MTHFERKNTPGDKDNFTRGVPILQSIAREFDADVKLTEPVAEVVNVLVLMFFVCFGLTSCTTTRVQELLLSAKAVISSVMDLACKIAKRRSATDGAPTAKVAIGDMRLAVGEFVPLLVVFCHTRTRTC